MVISLYCLKLLVSAALIHEKIIKLLCPVQQGTYYEYQLLQILIKYKLLSTTVYNV